MTSDALIAGSVLTGIVILAGVYYLEVRLKKKVETMSEIIGKCRQFIDNGVYDKAVEYGKEAVKMFPKEPNAYYCLAMAYFHTGDIQLALGNLEKAKNLANGLFNSFNPISIPIDKVKFYMDYAKVLKIKGDLDKAIKYYKKALVEAKTKKRNEIKEILQQLADTSSEAGKLENATNYYKELLLYTTDKEPIYRKLAFIYEKIGKKEIANNYLEMSFEEL
jgi:tetratricopeptide (TPR) repeat protein